MSMQGRRKFMHTCASCALAGASCILALGCRKETRASNLPDNPDTGQNRDDRFEPAYLKLHRDGTLRRRGNKLWESMQECRLCPRECGVDRLSGKKGICRASSELIIASYNPHFGEERPLVGSGGSGTIFFSHCSLRCVFCINWEISHGGSGSARSIKDLAAMMLDLQKAGCHNINTVTPTHYAPHILLALDIAAGKGLKLPLVYNTCGWERMENLRLLDGVVDIYLPDFKYSDGNMAKKYSSNALLYPQITTEALLEMHRQVGTARPSADGIVRRGLMLRHLVMPNDAGGTCDVIKWIAENLPLDTYVNIMSQYTPMYQAFQYPEIARRITRKEYDDAISWARQCGLTNCDIQGYR